MKYYYELTKSGLVFGNVITVIAGFLLGARLLNGVDGGLSVNIWLLVITAVGICLVMMSGCVFNNYIDRHIDAKMERTKHRALATHRISARNALVFASVLGVAGFLILIIFANLLAALAAAVGFFFYVVAYSMWAKRSTHYGTVVGAISGATPPVVGYAAASGRLDMAALILFLIMITWQMPHFFAIAIRRHRDYTAAGIPVMPVKHGIRRTKISMLIYITEFIVAASLLFVFGYAGYIYLSIVIILGIVWLVLCLLGFLIPDGVPVPAHIVPADVRWARRMFLFSLVVMMVLFITIAVGAIA
jgi:protoheme IX farnesyltransferase